MGEIIKLIAENGVLVVIAGVFIYLAVKQNRKQEKRQQELEKAHCALIDEQKKENKLLLETLIKELKNGKHTVDKEGAINKIEKNINILLKDLLYSTNAGRAYFVRYHNGGHDLNELSFLKMSMTNEVTRRGVSNAMNNFVNQFRSIFSWLIETLESGICVHIDDMEKLKLVSHSLYDYLLDQNVNRCHGLRITNSKKQVIGFIAISYLNDEKYLENDQIEEHLKVCQLKLETLLNADFE